MGAGTGQTLQMLEGHSLGSVQLWGSGYVPLLAGH